MRIRLNFFILLLSLWVGLVAHADGPYLYMLQKPLEITTELGPITRAAHVVAETGLQFVKAGLLFHATGDPTSALALLGVETIKVPPMITAQSMMDLQLRDWLKRKSKMKELADIPNLQRISIVTASEFQIDGVVAKKQNSTGLVFIETSQPLNADFKMKDGWGTPVPIHDPENTKLKFVLNVKGEKNAAEWTPNLKQVFAGDKLPKNVLHNWNHQVEMSEAEKTWIAKHFTATKASDLYIDVSLQRPNHEEISLGKMAQGKSAEKILGRSLMQKIWKTMGGDPGGKIPLSKLDPNKTCFQWFKNLQHMN